jgi:predicted small lipoprotein YifL
MMKRPMIAALSAIALTAMLAACGQQSQKAAD